MIAAREYTIRRKILTLLGAKFHIYDPAGNVIGFSKQKAFKLREDIRVYRDESQSEELLVIKARSVVDFSAAYDVTDPAGRRVGVLRRKGLASMLRDSWAVLDANEQPVGTIQEDSMALAMIRRFVANIIPQTFSLRDNAGTELAEFKQHFNPFVQKLTVTVSPNCPLDPIVPLAAGILLVAIEGRQQS